MKKSTLILLAILLFLGAAMYWFNTKETQQIKDLKAVRDFRYENIDNIDKLFIANRNGTTILFEKKAKHWTINKKYVATQSNVDLILEVFEQVQIKSVPNELAIKNINKVIATHGIKVEAYDKKDNLLKSFYVGGVNPTETGTYFIMEESNQPFLMELPYFVGSLRTRFDQPVDRLRSRLIFNENIDKIQRLEVKYPKATAESFVVIKESPDAWALSPLMDARPEIASLLKNDIFEKYLINFKKIGVEGYIKSPALQDSITNQTPFMTINIVDESGNEKYAEFWPIGLSAIKGPQSMMSIANSDTRYYVQTKDKSFAKLQHYSFSKAVRGYSDFYER